MRAVVVFESLFGNTADVAGGIADGLRGAGADVLIVAVADADPALAATADLLVLGGPTHVHGMASDRTRQGAVADAAKRDLPEPDAAGPALRTWLETLPPGGGRAAAAFDTRAKGPRLVTGSAASRIARWLDHHGYAVRAEESFVVEGAAGPLRAGEHDRAVALGRALVG